MRTKREGSFLLITDLRECYLSESANERINSFLSEEIGNDENDVYLIPKERECFEVLGARFWETAEARKGVEVLIARSILRDFVGNVRVQRALRTFRSFDDAHARCLRERAKREKKSLVIALAKSIERRIVENKSKKRVILLTSKKRRFACDDDDGAVLRTMHVLDYVKTFHAEDEDLIRRVTQATCSVDKNYRENETSNVHGSISNSTSGDVVSFSEYISANELSSGVANGSIVIGVFRMSHNSTAVVNGIRIESKNAINRAFHLDTVAVNIFTKEVVAIVTRSQTEFTCVLDEHDAEDALLSQRNSVLVIPRDSNIPRLRMFKTEPETLRGKIFSCVRFSEWPSHKYFPECSFNGFVGDVGTFKGEVDSVLQSCMIRKEKFGAKANDELPSSDWSIPEQELKYRRDFRNDSETLIFSIDPPGCVDVDDAISVKKMKGSGGYEIGVHIADVSFFVSEKSALDAEGKARGTTVYLPQERIDMLPEILSANLCSLLEGFDRLAVSCVWQCDEDLNIIEGIKPWFGRSIIRNKKAIDYYSAQALLDSKSDGTNKFYTALCVLTEFANKRRHIRELNGALELASAELRFETEGESGDGENLSSASTTTVKEKREVFTMKTVAELMISANCACAERIYAKFGESSFVRRHRMPASEAFDDIKKYCSEYLNYEDFDSSNGKKLNESLSKAVSLSSSGESADAFFRGAAAKKMQEAEYCVCDEGVTQSSHYGLAVALYSHFTSPIRRYADIIAHRQLLQAIGEGRTSMTVKVQELQNLAEHLNERTRSSKVAQRKVSEVYLAFSMLAAPKTKLAMVESFDADREILKVFLPSWHLRGNLFLRDESDVVSLETVGLGGVSVNCGERIFKPLQKIYVEVSALSSYKNGIQLKFRLSERAKLISSPEEEEDDDVYSFRKKSNTENESTVMNTTTTLLANAFLKSVTISKHPPFMPLQERVVISEEEHNNEVVVSRNFRSKKLDATAIRLLLHKSNIEMRATKTRTTSSLESKARYSRRIARLEKIR